MERAKRTNFGIKEELADRQGKISRYFLPEGIVQGSGMQQGVEGIAHVFLAEASEWFACPYGAIKSQNDKKLERSTPQERSILGNRKSKNRPIDEQGKEEG
jgi:hypothetical protein